MKNLLIAIILIGTSYSVSSQTVKSINAASAASVKPSEPRESKANSSHFVILRAVLANDGSFARAELTEKEISTIKSSIENKDANYESNKLAYESLLDSEFDLNKILNAYGVLGYELDGIIQPTAEMSPKIVTFILHKD